MSRFYSKQKGTALVTVVLIAAVVIVMVIESVKTIRFQKQLSANLINRDQAYSYLMGMEELAKIWLKRAFENEKQAKTVNLEQPWAQDDITFPIDGGAMTASITDMQSCFNLNIVAEPGNNNTGSGGSRGSGGGTPRGGATSGAQQNNQPRSPNGQSGSIPPGQKILEELISQTVESSETPASDLAAAVKDWIDEDFEPSQQGAEDDYYQGLEVAYRTPNAPIAHVSELRTIKGFNRKVYDSIKKLVCVLPKEVSKINVNTVLAENSALIYAALQGEGITPSEVQKALSDREEAYETVQDFIDATGVARSENLNTDYLGVTSEYFLVNAKAEIGKTRVHLKTIFHRDEDNNFTVHSRYYGRD